MKILLFFFTISIKKLLQINVYNNFNMYEKEIACRVDQKVSSIRDLNPQPSALYSTCHSITLLALLTFSLKMIIFVWTNSQVAGAMKVASHGFTYTMQVNATMHYVNIDFWPHKFTIINTFTKFAQTPFLFSQKHFVLKQDKYFLRNKQNIFLVFWETNKIFFLFHRKQN